MSEHDGDSKDLVGQAPDLSEETAEEKRFKIYRAVLSSTPFPFAGAIASLLSDLPKSRDAKVTKFLSELSEAVNHLSEEQQQTVHTDEFAHLLSKSLPSIATEYRSEKIDAYRNLLINALKIKASEELKESFLLRLDRMTPLHLLVFHLYVKHGAQDFSDPTKFDFNDAVSHGPVRKSAEDLARHSRLRAHDPSTIAAMFTDLLGMGLVEEEEPSQEFLRRAEISFAKEPRTRVSNYGKSFYQFVQYSS